MDGGRGNDTVSGSFGADTLSDGVGDDRVLGNSGADMINVGGGSDRVFAGDDNDTILIGVDGSPGTPSRHDFVDCGDGLDTVIFTDAGQIDPRDRFVNCENVN